MQILLCISFICLAGCQPGGTSQSEISAYQEGAYEYYFHESTGDNQFVLLNGREVKIQFNRDRSDTARLRDLGNLKWTVLYPNSRGQIKLYGLFSPATGDFILKDWKLSAPFKALLVKNEDELPLIADTIVKNVLDGDDFEKPADTSDSDF